MKKDTKEIQIQKEFFEKLCSDTRKKFLISKTAVFFGLCLMKYQWVLDFNSPNGARAYVALARNGLDNGCIYLSNEYVCQTGFTHNHLAFVLEHELLHILNGHGLRIGNRDPKIWNMATDHCINIFLRDVYEEEVHERYRNLTEPFGGWEEGDLVIFDELKDKDLKAEEVYEWLIKNWNERFASEELQPSEKDSDGQKNSGQSSVKWYKVTDKKTGRQYIVSDNVPDPQSARSAQADGRAIFENHKSIGKLPANIQRYLEAILHVEIPWNLLLDKAIKKCVKIVPCDRSFRNINIFYRPHDILLPGSTLGEENEGVGTLVIGVDTSGSISDKDLGEFSSIIMESSRHFREVRLLTHDVEIHQDILFNQDNINQFKEKIMESGFEGGGGTSHHHFFHVVEEMWRDNPDEVSMVVMLTDAYSDIESIWSTFNWTTHVPTVAILTKEHRNIELEGITQIVINSENNDYDI